jgi:hypothetical protein
MAGSRTLRATETTRVFSRKGPGDVTWYYGCLYSVNRRWRLLDEFNVARGDEVSMIRVAGPYVGFAYLHDTLLAGAYSTLAVLDLRTGRRKREISGPDLSLFPRNDYGDVDRVTDSVMMRSGAVAWISVTSVFVTEEGERPGCVLRGDAQDGECTFPYEVHKADATSKGKLLDWGHKVAPRSLALRGSRVYWRKGSTRHSATLK